MLKHIILDFTIGGFLLNIGQIKLVHVQVYLDMMLSMKYGQKAYHLDFVCTLCLAGVVNVRSQAFIYHQRPHYIAITHTGIVMNHGAPCSHPTAEIQLNMTHRKSHTVEWFGAHMERQTTHI